jgi:hypothetical protein
MKRAAFHRFGAALLTFAFLTARAGAAPLAPHAPNLSVHEESYGTVTKGSGRESIQSLELRLVGRNPGTTYQVQCFFLKKGAENGSPVVDDTVLFDVTDPHATYVVKAKPIRIRGGGGGAKGGPSPAQDPRAGYVVRVLSDGLVLRSQSSTPSLESEILSDPSLLEKASKRRAARRPDASDLLKR